MPAVVMAKVRRLGSTKYVSLTIGIRRAYDNISI